ncbi:MAG: HD domain-containing protein [Candidatus Aminicenantes bacterium]|nr:HD domain-containing protein [Candidatus Aminicenantes bacterium]
MKNLQIVVVEDESLVAKDIVNMVRGLGYSVPAVVSTGEEAIVVAEKTRPDIILMDIVLKGRIDGIEAAQHIWENLSIPVVYLTAFADEATLQRAKVTEPFGYILKPFDERELQTTIEMAFYKAQMEKKLRERERWLSTILRSIGDGVIVTDMNGRVTFMNGVAEHLTGWNQTEVLQRPLDGFIQIPLESNPAEEGLESTVNEGLLTTRDGVSIPIEQSVSPIYGEKKQIFGSVYIFRDIRSRKKSEEEIRQSYLRHQKALAGTIQAIGLTIEMRDPYTAGHQRRVSKLSCAIAEEMGLDAARIEGVRMAGDIHDIGKIYVPADILSKPGMLSDIEMSIIRTHSQVGYDILKNIEFPWPISQIIYQHHERLDGTGYPNKLKGNEILLEARIISVADVVEAMSSHRPYRPAPGIEKALDEVRRGRGLQYDADVVDICLRVFQEKKFFFE